MMPLKELAEHLYRARWPKGGPLHDEYRMACKDHKMLAALLLRVRAPAKSERGGA